MPRDPDSERKQPLASSPPPHQPLDEGGDPTSMTSSAPSQDQQRDALRAWFHSDAFKTRDGLDDYDQNYSTFHPLKDIITADMRHHIERRKQDARHEQDPLNTKVADMDPGATSEPPYEISDRKCRMPVPTDAERVLRHTEPSTLKFKSSGRLAIIGSEDQVIACAQRLGERLKCILLVDSDEQAGCRKVTLADGLTLPLIHGPIAELSGFIGKFHISIMLDNEKRPLTALPELNETGIDLVLDLASPPHIRSERPPLGYFAPGNDCEMLDRMMMELPDMVGEFEKPVFIFERPDLCAYHRSRFRGCDRCIGSCPADAIRSKGDAVEINHHLCQGCGLCAAVCPTGAVTNGNLHTDEILTRINDELHALQSAGTSASRIVFHEPDTDFELLEQIESESAGPSIRLPVDDIAFIGMDIWLGALAYGAPRVILVPSPQTTTGMRRTIKTQINYAALILKGMGYCGECIILADNGPPQPHAAAGLSELENRLSNLPAGAADFSPVPERRELMRLAIGHLYEQSPRTQTEVPLPPGAPFGAIRVDRDVCTFCMACAQVCPAKALAGGGDRPQLSLIEARCIQCGLCRRACPENAIALDPRFVYDRKISVSQHVLNREASFNCICCGKPFAAARLVERMEARLAGHWMYRSPQERRRLKMCRDCRLQDIFGGQHSKEMR